LDRKTTPALTSSFAGEGKIRKFELKKIGADWKFENMGNRAWP
jgi:hypothetical protein